MREPDYRHADASERRAEPPESERRDTAPWIWLLSLFVVAVLVAMTWLRLSRLDDAARLDQQRRSTPDTPKLAPETLTGPAVINVWLQGCADCMPAFDAATELERRGVWAEMTVRNIAYGHGDPAWARAHGVWRSLSDDPGGERVVKPLGISSFTTLVVDRRGKIVLRDRPGTEGFEERLKAAWARAGD